jgi:hypothetical protein
MISLVGSLRLSRIYSSDWSMEAEKNPDGSEKRRAMSGTSYKAQVIDEDAKIQPSLDIDKDLFQHLNLLDTKEVEKYIKKDLSCILEPVFQTYQGRTSTKLIIKDIKLNK